MQIRFLQALVFLTFLFCSCSEENSYASQKTEKDSSLNQTFFPVTEYIRGQLSEIDSLPVTPLKIISYNGKQDSVWMKKEDIRPFAQRFLYPEIDSAYLYNFYNQKSFLDQTINSITLTYEPKNNLADLKTITIYIDPKKNNVTRIYFVRIIIGNTGQQTFQFTWKSDQWCKITTIAEYPGRPVDIKEELMKWDFSE